VGGWADRVKTKDETLKTKRWGGGGFWGGYRKEITKLKGTHGEAGRVTKAANPEKKCKVMLLGKKKQNFSPGGVGPQGQKQEAGEKGLVGDHRIVVKGVLGGTVKTVGLKTRGGW